MVPSTAASSLHAHLWKWCLAPVLTLLALLVPATAPAQGRGAEGPAAVVLNVPNNGTDTLLQVLREIRGLRVENEDYLLRQTEKRGFRTQGIVDNHRELRWVMSGAKLDLIVRVTLQGASYNVDFITNQQARVARSFGMPASATFTASDAEIIADEVRAELKLAPAKKDVATTRAPTAPTPRPEPTRPQPTEPARPEPVAAVQPAQQAASAAPFEAFAAEPTPAPAPVASEPASTPGQEGRASWFHVDVGAGLTRKDLSAAGNNAIMTYRSAAFPGPSIRLKAVPARVGAMDLGGFLEYQHGFDALSLDYGTSVQSLSIQQLAVQTGMALRLGAGFGTDSAHTMLRAGVRYQSFGITANEQIPSSSITSILVGASLRYPLLASGLAVDAGVDMLPMGFFGESSELFGQTSSSVGAQGRLGLGYQLTPSLGAGLGYQFHLMRSKFEGDSLSEFRNTDIFDFMHGVEFAIAYSM